MTDNKIHYLAEEFKSHAELFKTLANKLETKGALEVIERDLILDIFKRSYASVMLFPVVELSKIEQIEDLRKEEKDEKPADFFSSSELESVFSKPSGIEGNPFIEVKEDNFVFEVEFEKEENVVEIEAIDTNKEEKAEIITNEAIVELHADKQEINIAEEEIAFTTPHKKEKIEGAEKQNITKKKSLAEQFNYPPALHEALANVLANKNLSSVLASRPISNLASGITLNDKFLFIRELFEGNNVVYEEVISQIDNSHSLSEAMHIVGRSIENVDFESGVAHKFIEIIHRRFSGY